MYKCNLRLIFAEIKLKDPKFRQWNFAKQVGIAPNTLSGIVSGGMPKFEHALRIVEVLNEEYGYDLTVHKLWIKEGELDDSQRVD